MTTSQSILSSLNAQPESVIKEVLIDLLRRFSSAPATEEVIAALQQPVVEVPDYEGLGPLTEKELRAMMLKIGFDPETDDDPGVQALNCLGESLREAGITYDDLMAQIKIEREKTIRRQFPSLIPLLDEVSLDGKTVS